MIFSYIEFFHIKTHFDGPRWGWGHLSNGKLKFLICNNLYPKYCSQGQCHCFFPTDDKLSSLLRNALGLAPNFSSPMFANFNEMTEEEVTLFILTSTFEIPIYLHCGLYLYWILPYKNPFWWPCFPSGW